MKKTAFLLILILVLSACSSTPIITDVIEPTTEKIAFTFNQDMPDKAIVNFPKRLKKLQSDNPDKFIKQLALYIKKNANNDFRVVKMAHDWVALNIRYDAKAYLSGIITLQDYYNVLATGKAVCAGYAGLFKMICDELKIECEIVSGYARGMGYTISKDERIVVNHDWNIVKIYGNWYLLDCTWDSGYIEGIKQVQNYENDYLFIKPERMIYDHFPLYQSNQLLEPPVTQDEFIIKPRLRPKFFYYIKDIKPNLNKITKVDGRIKTTFYINNNVYLSFDILDKNENEITNEKICKAVRAGNKYEVTLTFAEKGEYIFRLYANIGNKNTFEEIADYGLTVNSVYVPTEAEKKMEEIGERLKKENYFIK